MHTLSYFCILAIHRWLAYKSNCLSFVYTFVMHLALYILFLYMHVLRGASLEVFTQNICNNSIYFVIIKKGEIVGPKAISPKF